MVTSLRKGQRCTISDISGGVLFASSSGHYSIRGDSGELADGVHTLIMNLVVAFGVAHVSSCSQVGRQGFPAHFHGLRPPVSVGAKDQESVQGSPGDQRGAPYGAIFWLQLAKSPSAGGGSAPRCTLRD